MHTLLCQAIQARRLVQFTYDGTTRVVEPHMVAQNEADHYALSAWWISGHSDSGAPHRWREYLLSEMSGVVVLEQPFAGPRPGYKPSGGQKFHRVVCML